MYIPYSEISATKTAPRKTAEWTAAAASSAPEILRASGRASPNAAAANAATGHKSDCPADQYSTANQNEAPDATAAAFARAGHPSNLDRVHQGHHAALHRRGQPRQH